MSEPPLPSREEMAEAFRFQARAAAANDSPIYVELLTRAGADVEAGGVFAELVEGWRGRPALDAMPLRLFGGLHALALSGRAPELARFYPSCGGRFQAEPAWQAVRGLARRHFDELRVRLGEPVQTNEVRRCAGMLGGFLTVADRYRLPLRLFEIGASAGLNLLWDRYRYELGPHRWGDPASPVVLRPDWRGPPPPLEPPVEVVSRAGCDLAPIDLTRSESRLRLESFIWPEQLDRLEILRAALGLALSDPPALAQQSASAWLAAELSPREGSVAVLFQSVVWWYLGDEEREAVRRTVEAAGAAAGPRSPLAWLRFEGTTVDRVEVRLRCWPGGEDRRLGSSRYHGTAVQWGDEPAPDPVIR